MTPIRVLLADDHAFVRCGFRGLLDTAPGILVVGEACDGIAALEQTIELRPDVLVLDVEMPGLRGNEVARRLRAMDVAVRILILSFHTNKEQIDELLASGADGYVAKDEPIETILQAIRDVTAQERSRPDAAPNPPQHVPDSGRKQHPLLTERQAEILDLAVLGKTNREIAEQLGISERTVRFHLGNIYRKLNVRGRCEAVVWTMGEHPDPPPP